ncbi:hypothetical protein CMO96_02810, partial [Candidatus Woesebacteria bacterium]|nr:hypothetical protein [Candidatus Woesebacteria bacterium]
MVKLGMALMAIHNEKEFRVGDTVQVHQKIQEDASSDSKANKKRTQEFQGTVIGINGKEGNKMFTVRRLGSTGIGIERIFPLYSPLIERVEVVARGFVRRS